MTEFEVSGKFKVGKSWQAFTKVLDSQNEKNAVENVLSLLGSEQGVKRNFIEINEVTPLD